MFGDFFLNFWLQRPNEDKEIEDKTTNIRQLGLGHTQLSNPTRRSPLPSGPGGGLPSPLGGPRRPPEVFGISGYPFAAGHLGDLTCLGLALGGS